MENRQELEPPDERDDEEVDVSTRSFLGYMLDWVRNFKRRGWFKPLVLRAVPLWMTPNQITVARTALIVPIVWCIWNEWYLYAFDLAAIAFIGDNVDGTVAIARNQQTVLGAFLDPLADKVLVVGTLFALADRLPRPFLLPIFLCGSIAIALTAIRCWRIAHSWWSGKEVPYKQVAAKKIGQLKMIIEVSAVLLLLLACALANAILVWIAGLLLVGAVFLAGWSFYRQFKS